MPPPAGVQSVDLVVDGLSALGARDPLPPAFDNPSIATLNAWLDALAGAADDVVVSGTSPGRIRTCRIYPRATSERVPIDVPTPRPAEAVTVEGLLYAVNLHTGRYKIEDDARNTINLVVPAFEVDDIGPLVDRRVRASGRATRDGSARIQVVTAKEVGLAPDSPGDATGPFQPVALADLVRGIRPIESTDELAIDGLSDEEAVAFLAAIDE